MRFKAMKKNYVLLGCMLLTSILSYGQSNIEIKEYETKPLYDFSIDLFDKLQKKQPKKNFICSPFGVASLYRILGDGAEGTTRKEIDKTIGIDKKQMSYLVNYLKCNNEEFNLDIANQIILNEKYNLKEDYKKEVESSYQAMMERMDFSDNNSVTRINNWCKNKTKGMIPTILDTTNPAALLYALNCIYMKGKWLSPFKEEKTKIEKFKLLSGTKIPMDIMRMEKIGLLYGETNVFKSLSLDYMNADTKRFSLLLLLPNNGKKLDEITKYLKNHSLKEIDDIANDIIKVPNTEHHVHVKLPKFETSTETNILETLKSMGITHLGFPEANFSNMTDEKVGINDSKQKAKIIVNEKGTEAAAITEALGIMGYGAGPKTEPEIIHHYFYATKPFIYLLVNEDTNTILLMGQFTGED